MEIYFEYSETESVSVFVCISRKTANKRVTITEESRLRFDQIKVREKEFNFRLYIYKECL